MRRALVGLLAGVVTLAGCAIVPPDRQGSMTLPGAGARGATVPGAQRDAKATRGVPVYFPRPSTTGVRLGRELRLVDPADALRGALEAMLSGPLDPDYLNGWPQGTRVLSASTAGDVTTVDLSSEARATTLTGDGVLAQGQQLVWTVTELVGPHTAVRLTIDGDPVHDLWGSPYWDEPQRRDTAYATRVLVSIDSPQDGARVTTPVAVVGDAAVEGGTMPWRVVDATGREVRRGEVAAGRDHDFAPYGFSVDLPAGDYTVEVEEGHSDGEGRHPDIDTRRFTVG